MAPARLSLCCEGLAHSVDTRGRGGLRDSCGLWLLCVAPGEVRAVRALRWWVREKDVSPGTKDQLPHIPSLLAMRWAVDSLLPSRLLHVALGCRGIAVLAARLVLPSTCTRCCWPSASWAPLPARALPETARL